MPNYSETRWFWGSIGTHTINGLTAIKLMNSISPTNVGAALVDCPTYDTSYRSNFDIFIRHSDTTEYQLGTSKVAECVFSNWDVFQEHSATFVCPAYDLVLTDAVKVVGRVENSARTVSATVVWITDQVTSWSGASSDKARLLNATWTIYRWEYGDSDGGTGIMRCYNTEPTRIANFSYGPAGGLTVTQDALLFVGSSNILQTNGGTPFESKTILQGDGVVGIEPTQTTQGDNNLFVELLGGVNQDRETQFDSLTTIQQTRESNLEWLSILSATRDTQFESLITSLTDFTVPVEWTGSVSLITQDGIIPLESIMSLQANSLYNIESLSGTIQDSVIPYQYLGNVIKDGAIPFENIATLVLVTQNGEVPYEFLTKINTDKVLSIDSLAKLKQDGIFPVNFSGIVLLGVIRFKNTALGRGGFTNVSLLQK